MIKQDVHFANVDLEVEGKCDLQPLIDDFGADISVQYHDRLENGNDFASIALDKMESGVYGEPDKTVLAFCDLIEKISSGSRDIWNLCEKKELDMGFESGNTDKTFTARLEPETIARVAEIRASIEITIYPVRDN